MVVATFWYSYIAAYKMWRYFYGKDSAKLANMILQQSLKNNGVREYVKTEKTEFNYITKFTSNDDCNPVEWQLAAIIQEIPVHMEIVYAFTPEFAFQIEGVSEIKEISFEEEKVCSIAHELSLEKQTVSEFVPQFALGIEKEKVCSIAHELSLEQQTVGDVKENPLDELKVSGIAHEMSVEIPSVSEALAKFAITEKSVNKVGKIQLEEEKAYGVAHELSLKEQTVSDFVPHFPFEMESVREIKEIPLKEETVNSVAHELSSEVQTVSEISVPAFQVENVSALNELVLEEGVPYAIAHEFSSQQQTESVVMREVPIEGEATKEIVKEIPVERDMISEIAPKCSAEVKPIQAKVETLNKTVNNLCCPKKHESSETITPKVQAVGSQIDAGPAKRYPLGMNAEAEEFVPRQIRISEFTFGGADGGTMAVRNRESAEVEREVKDPVKLNAKAEAFVPSTQISIHNQLQTPSFGGVIERAAAVFTATDTGIDKHERSLNAYAKEFIPSHFQRKADDQRRGPLLRYDAPAMAPVYRPSRLRPAPGFRPRGPAGFQHRPLAGRFPLNHQRPRLNGAQQVPPYGVTPRWSTADN